MTPTINQNAIHCRMFFKIRPELKFVYKFSPLVLLAYVETNLVEWSLGKCLSGLYPMIPSAYQKGKEKEKVCSETGYFPIFFITYYILSEEIIWNTKILLTFYRIYLSVKMK